MVAIVVASALVVVGFAAMLMLALGRAAALADEDSERALAEHRVHPAIRGYRQSYAGFARGHYETFRVPSMPAARWPGTEQ